MEQGTYEQIAERTDQQQYQQGSQSFSAGTSPFTQVERVIRQLRQKLANSLGQNVESAALAGLNERAVHEIVSTAFQKAQRESQSQSWQPSASDR